MWFVCVSLVCCSHVYDGGVSGGIAIVGVCGVDGVVLVVFGVVVIVGGSIGAVVVVVWHCVSVLPMVLLVLSV